DRLLFVQAEDGIRAFHVTGVQTCALPISGQSYRADAAVVATGAWLSAMAREWGVRVPVRAGRGYSFTVAVDREIPGPIYLPEVQIGRASCSERVRGVGIVRWGSGRRTEQG